MIEALNDLVTLHEQPFRASRNVRDVLREFAEWCERLPPRSRVFAKKLSRYGLPFFTGRRSKRREVDQRRRSILSSSHRTRQPRDGHALLSLQTAARDKLTSTI
jgi:hypothetical protein